MIIEVPKVSEEGSRYVGEESGQILDLGADAHVRVEGPIQYDLFAERISGELVVRGKVSVRLSLECSRCADFFSTTLEDSSFLRSYEAPESVETVELTDDIREAILLDLPAYPVCALDCKGLCSQCGKNLNTGACACRPPPDENRWDALDKLGLKV